MAVDLTEATLKFALKKYRADAAYTIEKTDADFTKDDAVSGIVDCSLSESDTNIDAGNYFGELKTTLSGSSIDKSNTLKVKVDEAVITD